jgi:UDP-2,3-diacylglucosamine pyrophosphatase LpxH
MKKKVFISDLHLGDGSKADDFHRDQEVINLLDFCKDNNADVYLLGDIFELWQAHLDKIIWAHIELYKRLAGCTRKAVWGNHDALPFELLWKEHFENKLIYAEHGHQYDMFNKFNNPMRSLKKPKTPIGKYITQAVGLLERFWHRDTDTYLLKLKKKYGGFLYRAGELQNKKCNMAPPMENEKLITIHGHTHRAELTKYGDGKIYANCGTWIDDKDPTYILVDEDSKQIGLYDGITHEMLKKEWFD